MLQLVLRIGPLTEIFLVIFQMPWNITYIYCMHNTLHTYLLYTKPKIISLKSHHNTLSCLVHITPE
jgi:hypothetical protein